MRINMTLKATGQINTITVINSCTLKMHMLYIITYYDAHLLYDTLKGAMIAKSASAFGSQEAASIHAQVLIIMLAYSRSFICIHGAQPHCCYHQVVKVLQSFF